MKKTFQQFIAENPHFADVQQMRETGDHSGYLRRALEKAWQAGYDAGLQVPLEFEMRLPDYSSPHFTGQKNPPGWGEEHGGIAQEPTKHADISAAASPYDKRLGATGEAVE